MDIAHQKIHDRIDRLAQIQICYVWKDSYARIHIFKTNTIPICMRCERE